MRRVPGGPVSARPAGRSSRRNFWLFALGSVWTFVMAARAVQWFGGPLWLGLVFIAAGLALAGYYLVRELLRWRRARQARR
ncbi:MULTISPECIES: hypothetical protein [Arthrobacter]|uniref:Uncharacterized protein n=1 Tax=Arthrobacter oryzae TaxID=409290 RepID=A0A3N0BW54_9MICC|nr:MULTISPECIES: hypothetical protein [Arthrobacter]QYF89860.1 hypothetical protein KY499_00065 [Arthrobacter sp. PAMC25284]RNL53937.1 hypothetical protein D7003_11730 [Arthrobacter oryzae]